MGRAKAASNLAKHGLPFDRAVRVFLDHQRVELDVSRGFDNEPRRKAIGQIDGKLYVAVFTDRAGVRRLISARRANKTEQQAYGPLHPRSD
jgi:uncharacterized DUF497 family protein